MAWRHPAWWLLARRFCVGMTAEDNMRAAVVKAVEVKVVKAVEVKAVVVSEGGEGSGGEGSEGGVGEGGSQRPRRSGRRRRPSGRWREEQERRVWDQGQARGSQGTHSAEWPLPPDSNNAPPPLPKERVWGTCAWG